MTVEEIESRFPFLKEGEVIFVCSDGLFFNQGTVENRRKLSRRYCFKHNLDQPEMVEKKAPKKAPAKKKNNS